MFFGGLLMGMTVLGLLGALGVIELALRYSDPELMVRRRGIHRYHPRLGWEPRPWAQSSEEGIATTIGPLGHRITPTATSVEGAVRVMFVGDSLTFGAGVSDEETFAFLLGEADGRYQVTNLAVEGYGPGQSLLRMEEALDRSSADVVILGICLGNDVADVASAYHLYDESIPKPRFVLTAGELVLEDRHVGRGWIRGLVDSSFLLARAAAPVEAVAPRHESVSRRLQALRAVPESTEETLVAIIRRMRDGVEGQGGRLLVVLLPDARTLERSSARWPRLRDKLQPEVELLDLVTVIASDREAYASHVLDAIGHLSPQGHKVAAAAIRERLALILGPSATRTTPPSRPGPGGAARTSSAADLLPLVSS